MRLIVPILFAAVIAGLATAAVLRARRRRAAVPELNRHPERLEQMLDATDDA